MTNQPRLPGLSPQVWVTCLALILAIQALGGLADPGADPPLGPSDLEGQLLLGARALLPGASLPLGDWAPHRVAPLHAAVHAAGFLAGGEPSIRARRLTAGIAVLATVLFFFLVRASTGSGTALLAALFLVVNPVAFALTRVALPAILSLLVMLSAMACARSTRPGIALLAGGLTGAAGTWIHPTHNLFFLGAAGIVYLGIRLHAWKMTWKTEAVRRVRWMLAGVGLALLLPLGLLATGKHPYVTTWEHFSWGSWRLLAANLVLTPAVLLRLATWMPVTILLALGTFLFYAKDAVRPIMRHRELDEVRLWFLAWILAGVPFFFLVAEPPPEALVLLVPPVCVLAAEGLVRLYRARRLARPEIDVMIVMLLIAGSAWLLVATGIRSLLGDRAPDGFLARHQIRATWLLVIPIWVAMTALGGWLWLRWRRFTVPLRPGPVLALVLLMGSAVPVLGLGARARWWQSRTHEVATARAAVPALPRGALVVGSWAPTLTLDLPVRATLVWPGLNDAPRSWHVEVTHLVLQEGSEASPDRAPRSLFEAEPMAATGTTTLGGRRLRWYEVPSSP